MAKLGVTAALTPGLTIHTETFVSAVNTAMATLPEHISRKVEIEWFCDQMSAQGGSETSKHFVSAGVDAVVGHFSSRAAAAAIPIYLTASIPVILPCSSQNDLTSENVHNATPFVFRLSASDTALISATQKLLHKLDRVPEEILVWAADSIYAKELMKVAEQVFGGAGVLGNTCVEKALLLLGHHYEVLNKIEELRGSGCNAPIIIVDDAVDNDLTQKLEPQHAHSVFGITSALRASGKQVDKPQDFKIPFYRETHMAVEIAATALAHGANREVLAQSIRNTKWSCLAGVADFDRCGENRALEFCVWEIKKGVFQQSFVL